VAQPFHAVINLQVASDTTGLFPVPPNNNLVQGTFAFDSVTIHSVSFNPPLPTGVTMTYSCSPSNCKFLGASTGCIDLNVSPISTTGIYRIYVNTVAKGTFTPQLLPIPLANQVVNQVVDRYRIVVDDSSTFITEYDGDLSKFQIVSVQNNMASQQVSMTYYSPNSKSLQVEVFDLCGKSILKDQLAPKAGENTISFNSAMFSNGIYFVSLSNSKNRTSKKFIIQQ
jgi:hypothetical protein